MRASPAGGWATRPDPLPAAGSGYLISRYDSSDVIVQLLAGLWILSPSTQTFRVAVTWNLFLQTSVGRSL